MSAAVAEPSAAAAAVPGRRRGVRPELLLAGLAFFASGASGLVYQVAWQRILALHSGVGIYSIAMIVGAFMAGLGVGSHFGGPVQPARGPPAARCACSPSSRSASAPSGP